MKCTLSPTIIRRLGNIFVVLACCSLLLLNACMRWVITDASNDSMSNASISRFRIIRLVHSVNS